MAILRRKKKTEEDDAETTSSLLNKTMAIELSEMLDTRPKHKTSDCDEHLVDSCDSDNNISPLIVVQKKLNDQRSITFANVEVRQYKRCMDYHPCVSSGVPIGLDWEFEIDETLTLDEYENSRLAERVDRQRYAYIGRLDAR